MAAVATAANLRPIPPNTPISAGTASLNAAKTTPATSKFLIYYS